MTYGNVKLWFARNKKNEIVTIDEIKKDCRETYNCPICNTVLLPKAIQSVKITPHFAHFDSSQCDSESHIHWWFKNKLIEPGDEFKIITDKERTYICKQISLEKSFSTSFGEYRPDLTVITENNETIFFEMAFSNKKKVNDYLDIWVELNNIVVEVNIKDMMKFSEQPTFKSLFHIGKSFNFRKNDVNLSIIEKYKRLICKDGVSEDVKKRVRNLDWFWLDVLNYHKGFRDIAYMTNLIDNTDSKDLNIIEEILNKKACVGLYKEYLDHKSEKVWSKLKKEVLNQYGESHLEYIKKPFTQSNRYLGANSYLEVFHEEERCYYVINLKFVKIDKIIESVLKTMQKNSDFKLNKQKIKLFHEKQNVLYEKISRLVNEKNMFANIKGLYSVKYHENNGYLHPSKLGTKHDFNSFKFRFTLNYNNHRTCSSEEITVNEYSNIEKLISSVESSFEGYISRVKTLDNIKELDLIVKNLRDEFLLFDIVLEGKQTLEDEYEIRVDYISDGDFPPHYFSSYTINNHGLYKDYKRTFITNDRNLIKNKLINDIKKELVLSFSRGCVDCREIINLNMGEAVFYKRKGLKFPKRCGSCRKRKIEYNY